MMRIFIIQVHDPVIHLEVDEEQLAITRGGKRQTERTGFLAPLITCQGYDTQMLLMHGLSYVPRGPETQRKEHLSIKVTK